MTRRQLGLLSIVCSLFAGIVIFQAAIAIIQERYWLGTIFILVALASLAGIAELNRRREP